MTLYSPREIAVRRVTVSKDEMVFLRHVIEASEGLGFIVAESGGDAFVMSSTSQEAELDQLLSDLSVEMSLHVWGDYCADELERMTR